MAKTCPINNDEKLRIATPMFSKLTEKYMGLVEKGVSKPDILKAIYSELSDRNTELSSLYLTFLSNTGTADYIVSAVENSNEGFKVFKDFKVFDLKVDFDTNVSNYENAVDNADVNDGENM